MSAEQNLLQSTTSGFEPNAILRGAQLTLVGAYRSLQNPKLFTSAHYRQVAYAIAAGIVIRIVIAIPTLIIRLLLTFLGLFTESAYNENVIEGIEFVEHSVLQVPFLLMTLMHHISPSMDNLFMDSLDWVDRTYFQKHKGDDPSQLRALYYPNLRLYESYHPARIQNEKKKGKEAAKLMVQRFGRKAMLSLSVYLLTFVPYIGPLVLPASSFLTFDKAVGTQPALIIFGSSLFLPKRYLVMFLQSYFSSRSLMRELLDPYFSRIKYDSKQKKLWFRDRAGVLYGFALAFFIFLQIPLLGVVIYGIAEASTAYLITKITEPPPPPQDAESFKERDVRWVNKHEFLNLPLEKLDRLNVKTAIKESPSAQELLPKEFT